MQLVKLALLMCLLVSLSGCFTVHAVSKPEDTYCNLITRELEVQLADDATSARFIADIGQSAGNSGEALALIIAVPVTTFIISGSVAVVGNVVHWVEKQGKCDDSFVRTFTASANDSITAAGGTMIDSASEFSQWLQSL